MSRIAIIGGHGQIALHLSRILTQGGHDVIGVVRNPDHLADLAEVGAKMAVIDLEEDTAETLAGAITGCDAVVFAAGAGAGSGAERKWTVDKGGAVKLIEACHVAGIKRYVMVSSMGTDDPPAGEDVFEQYLRAKAEADQALMDSGLDWTVLRPGMLTDGPATGAITLDRHVPRGAIPREDVAKVIALVLQTPDLADRVVEVVSGGTPVPEAVRAAASA